MLLMRTSSTPIGDMPGKRADDVTQLTIRFPKEWLERIDALARKMAPHGLEFTRTDVMRVVVARGLDEVEREQALAKRTGKSNDR
jgi:hypothetical protein